MSRSSLGMTWDLKQCSCVSRTVTRPLNNMLLLCETNGRSYNAAPEARSRPALSVARPLSNPAQTSGNFIPVLCQNFLLFTTSIDSLIVFAFDTLGRGTASSQTPVRWVSPICCLTLQNFFMNAAPDQP